MSTSQILEALLGSPHIGNVSGSGLSNIPAEQPPQTLSEQYQRILASQLSADPGSSDNPADQQGTSGLGRTPNIQGCMTQQRIYYASPARMGRGLNTQCSGIPFFCDCWSCQVPSNVPGPSSSHCARSSGAIPRTDRPTSASLEQTADQVGKLFLKRRSAMQRKSKKLCWGYTRGKLTVLPVGQCENNHDECLLQMRKRNYTALGRIRPDIYTRMLLGKTPTGARSVLLQGLSDQPEIPQAECDRLQQLMSGCHIDERMDDAEDLTRRMGLFNLANEASGSNLNRDDASGESESPMVNPNIVTLPGFEVTNSSDNMDDFFEDCSSSSWMPCVQRTGNIQQENDENQKPLSPVEEKDEEDM